MNTRFEITVPRQHGRTHQIAFIDGVVDLRREVARVADARGAAIAGQRKAQLFQERKQPGLGQIFSHDARARRQRCLDVRLHLQARLDRFFGQQAGCQQHARVGCVGATGNGGNQHIAVADRDARLHRCRRVDVLASADGRGKRRAATLHFNDHARRAHRCRNPGG